MSTNVPVTTWRDTNGLTEYSNGGIFNIDDNLSQLLIDPSGTFIVDTGVLANLIPASVWEEDNSI